MVNDLKSVTEGPTKNSYCPFIQWKKSLSWKVCHLRTIRNVHANVPHVYLCFLGERCKKGGDLASLNQKSTIIQLQVANKVAVRSLVLKLTMGFLPQIYYYSGGQSYSYGEFKNRITAATGPGNASITISNMQPSDTGSYTCEVFSPLNDAGQSQKSVIVNVLGKCLFSVLLYCSFPALLQKEFTPQNKQQQREWRGCDEQGLWCRKKGSLVYWRRAFLRGLWKQAELVVPSSFQTKQTWPDTTQQPHLLDLQQNLMVPPGEAFRFTLYSRKATWFKQVSGIIQVH